MKIARDDPLALAGVERRRGERAAADDVEHVARGQPLTRAEREHRGEAGQHVRAEAVEDQLHGHALTDGADVDEQMES